MCKVLAEAQILVSLKVSHKESMVNPVQCLAVTALGDMCCTTTSTLSPTPGACLVKVHYSTLNRLDTLQRSGKMAPPAGASDILGLEFSGTIVHSPLPHLVPGDRVAGLVSHCGHSEYTYCDPQHLFKIPDSYPLRSAACIPENWITAYQLITAVGGLSPSSTVLIHAAASGVGLALIQVSPERTSRETPCIPIGFTLGSHCVHVVFTLCSHIPSPSVEHFS